MCYNDRNKQLYILLMFQLNISVFRAVLPAYGGENRTEDFEIWKHFIGGEIIARTSSADGEMYKEEKKLWH